MPKPPSFMKLPIVVTSWGKRSVEAHEDNG
jgi:hypothetical protein